MGQPDHQSFKDEQIDAYKNLLACLDEINRILERIRAKYTNSFDEDKLKANRNLDGKEISHTVNWQHRSW